MEAFVCRDCGYRSRKWLGRCPGCSAWDALQAAQPAARPGAEALPFTDVRLAEASRIGSGVAELDHVLGGGLVPGAVVLVGGEPGIGKSTLLLQAASALADRGARVLYASGEESAPQVRTRGERLGVRSANLLIAALTEVDEILAVARDSRPQLVIVDSVQAVRCGDSGSLPGSPAQVREAAGRFVAFAKNSSTPMLLVGHVTKDGAIAGPRTLEHVVDTVLQFEGDRHHEYRILRALKNRFGPSDEIAVFTMGETGLAAVASPSEWFLSERSEGAPGSAVLAAVEGTRPLLVEVQALVGDTGQGPARRISVGVDPQRVALVLAVLAGRTGLELAGRDVFVNVTGGLHLREPAADLAVAVAVVSSLSGRPVPAATILAGEIGLTGEVRAIGRLPARLREAGRLGFERACVPLKGQAPETGIAVIDARRVDQVLAELFDAPRGQIG